MEWWYCKTQWNGYGMLPGTCGGKEAGAGNTALFRVNWLQLAIK